MTQFVRNKTPKHRNQDLVTEMFRACWIQSEALEQEARSVSVVIVVVVVVLGRLIMSVIVVLNLGLGLEMGCRSMEARAIMAIFLEDWEKSREEEGDEAEAEAETDAEDIVEGSNGRSFF